jgi:hypothetical protein
LNVFSRADFSQLRLAELRKEKSSRTATEMSQGPSTPPARIASKEPRTRFNWPPTDDELAQYGVEAQYGDPELTEAGLDAGEPVAADVSPPTATVGLFPSETCAPERPGLPPEASSPPAYWDFAVDAPAALFTLSEPEPFLDAPLSAPASWTPGDQAETPSDSEDSEDFRSDAPPASGMAVSLGATAADSPGTDDFAAEIAQLQALIEALTQKIDWRIPNVAGR